MDTDITSENFEIPVTNIDFVDTIDSACDKYYSMPRNKKETKEFRIKLNELIDEYNERRGLKIFNQIK